MKRHERRISSIKGPNGDAKEFSNGGNPSLSNAEKTMETHNANKRKKWEVESLRREHLEGIAVHGGSQPRPEM